MRATTNKTSTVKGGAKPANKKPATIQELKDQVQELTYQLAITKEQVLNRDYEIEELKSKRITTEEGIRMDRLTRENEILKRELTLLEADSVRVAFNVHEQELLKITKHLLDWCQVSDVLSDLNTLFSGFLHSSSFKECGQKGVCDLHFTHYRICEFFVEAQEVKNRMEATNDNRTAQHGVLDEFTCFCDIERLENLLSKRGVFDITNDKGEPAKEGITQDEAQEVFFLREFLKKLKSAA